MYSDKQKKATNAGRKDPEKSACVILLNSPKINT